MLIDHISTRLDGQPLIKVPSGALYWQELCRRAHAGSPVLLHSPSSCRTSECSLSASWATGRARASRSGPAQASSALASS
eukprot:6210972-Pleurochrysis_carterae.AAC.9